MGLADARMKCCSDGPTDMRTEMTFLIARMVQTLSFSVKA